MGSGNFFLPVRRNQHTSDHMILQGDSKFFREGDTLLYKYKYLQKASFESKENLKLYKNIFFKTFSGNL